MAIIRDKAARTITLHHEKYINDLVEQFGLQDAIPLDVPSIANEPRQLPPVEDPSNLRSLVGAVLYASTIIRPDIKEVVDRLCRMISPPAAAHWEDAKHVLKYLKHFRRGVSPLGERTLSSSRAFQTQTTQP
jgi:hypothetical protein